MPPQSTLCNWSDRLRHARFWRNEVKKSLGEPLNSLQVISGADGEYIMALGNLPGDVNNQTLMTAKITPKLEMLSPTLELQPFLMLDAQEAKANEPSAEVALFYERLRGQVVNGISGYSYHDSGAILLSSFNKLQVYKQNNIQTIAEWFTGTILNANFSPTSTDYVAFCSSGQLFIDKCNEKAYESDGSNLGITNGVASFIAQEELERFDGYWWSPSRLELLYERVDETKVTRLAFECPGKPPATDPIRYPLVGTYNADSTLRMVSFESSLHIPIDKHLGIDLTNYVPWQKEYLVRAGWTDDGNFVYSLFMDRLQTKMAILLISRAAFISDGEQLMNHDASLVRVVYQESSSIWLNSNNLTRFIKPTINPEVLPLIYGSEKNNHCHLFMRNYELSNPNSISEDVTLTSGDWSVIKDGHLVIDTSRELIYFLANRLSPLIVSLCVTSYRRSKEVRTLTPNDLCYKFERGQNSLNINPNVGFVCWLSSLTNLPECRFYRLVHNSTLDELPTAVFQYNVNIKDSNVSPDSPLQPPIPLTNLFRSQFYEYKSQGSGEIHYALLLWPSEIWTYDKKYPLIMNVYAGPGVQLVRNNWHIIAQFLKYITVGYAVLIVDGRGSSNRGINFESPIKERMGSVEVADQVEGLLHVARESGLIDLRRVGVMGWSYGGYMALCLLISHPDIFRASCAGGAVVDWSLYDTCYTERYMGAVDKNSNGYKESCILGKVTKLPDEEGRLLIVHGLIDENVHFVHTEKLINALISNGKPFQQLIFPSERHGVRNAEAVEFFHASIISFFDKSLR